MEGTQKMADSNITKKALAASLKELMKDTPFAKISVGDICERCEMNRKSFYYHFKDKFDLVNWIYYNEFARTALQNDYASSWDFIRDICDYFYEQRDFYRKVLKISGQNSFSEYFTELLLNVFTESFKDLFGDDPNHEFYAGFIANSFVSAIIRWLTEKDCMPSEEFVSLLKSCVIKTAEKMMESR